VYTYHAAVLLVYIAVTSCQEHARSVMSTVLWKIWSRSAIESVSLLHQSQHHMEMPLMLEKVLVSEPLASWQGA